MFESPKAGETCRIVTRSQATWESDVVLVEDVRELDDGSTLVEGLVLDPLSTPVAGQFRSGWLMATAARPFGLVSSRLVKPTEARGHALVTLLGAVPAAVTGTGCVAGIRDILATATEKGVEL